MQLSIFFIVAIGFIIMCASLCSCDPIRPSYERNENMSRPTRPKIFSTPEELKSYLEELGNFYAIAGRPRFGKRTLAPWAASYLRDDPGLFRNLPISLPQWYAKKEAVEQKFNLREPPCIDDWTIKRKVNWNSWENGGQTEGDTVDCTLRDWSAWYGERSAFRDKERHNARR